MFVGIAIFPNSLLLCFQVIMLCHSVSKETVPFISENYSLSANHGRIK